MDKHTALARVSEDLQAHPAVVRACVAIINYLDRVPIESLQRITFGTLSSVAGYKEVSDVLPAIQYLIGARVGIFETAYYFFDPNGEEIPLAASIVSSAHKDKEFFHPETGERVTGFEQRIGIEFVLARDTRGKFIAEWAGG